MPHEEAEQLAGRNSKSTLLRVKHEVYLTEAVEGLAEVLDERPLAPGLDDDVVHVSLDVAAQLRAKALSHRALEGCSRIFEQIGRASCRERVSSPV